MKLNWMKVLPFSWYYLLVVAFILGTIQLLQEYIDYVINQYDYDFSWYFISVKFYGGQLSWVILAPLVYQLAQMLVDWLSQKDWRQFGRIIGFALLIVLLRVVVFTILVDALNAFKLGYFTSWWQENRKSTFLIRTFLSLVQLIIFAGFFVTFTIYQNYQQKEKELDRARLDALLMQLQPHFLFNTLHSVAALIDWDSKAAQKMIAQLGDILRQLLKNENRHLVPLEEEIRFIKNYLEIEQIRFQDRLKIRIDAAPNTNAALVPNLLLQPLVENALKHGLAKKMEDGRIHITSRMLEDGQLQVQICDNGAGFDPKQETGHGLGVGLQNVEKRLRQQYGDAHQFTIETEEGQGCTIIIQIPFSISDD